MRRSPPVEHAGYPSPILYKILRFTMGER